MYRVGCGLDSHRVKPSKQKFLLLGGVKVSREYCFVADSDGDVVLHSLSNALSTALGGGSLDTWAGTMCQKGITDSKEYLKVVLKKMRQQGFKLINVAVMVEAGKPRLEPFRERMQKELAALLGIDKKAVGIAFTTGKKLTSFGRGEGIQAISTVLIAKSLFS